MEVYTRLTRCALSTTWEAFCLLQFNELQNNNHLKAEIQHDYFNWNCIHEQHTTFKKKKKSGGDIAFSNPSCKNTWMVRRVLTAALMLTCGRSVAVQIKTEHICLPPQWHKAAAFALNSLPHAESYQIKARERPSVEKQPRFRKWNKPGLEAPLAQLLTARAELYDQSCPPQVS